MQLKKAGMAIWRMIQDVLVNHPWEERRREARGGDIALGQEVEACSDAKENAEWGGPDPVSIGLELVAESGPERRNGGQGMGFA